MNAINMTFTNAPTGTQLPTGVYDADFQNKVNAILAFYSTNTAESNTFIAKMEAFVAEANTLSTAVNGMQSDTQVIHDGIVVLKADTQVLKTDTQIIRDSVSSMMGTHNYVASGWNNTIDFKNKATHYNGYWWSSVTAGTNLNNIPSFISTKWAYIGDYIKQVTILTATHVAVSGEIIKVNPTAIGANCIITLPTIVKDFTYIKIINTDMINTNTLTIKRGDITHRISGELENGELNSECVTCLTFVSDNKNWLKG